MKKNIKLIRISILIIVSIIVIFGIVLPYLISSKHTELVILGGFIIIAVIYVAAVQALKFINSKID